MWSALYRHAVGDWAILAVVDVCKRMRGETDLLGRQGTAVAVESTAAHLSQTFKCQCRQYDPVEVT